MFPTNILILEPNALPGATLMATDNQGRPGETLVLTRALVRGDDAAWRQFHELYSGRLHRYLLVVARGDEDSAAEVLQLTFVRISRHIRAFESEAVFWSWLTVLARSAAVDEARKRQRRIGLLSWFQKQSADSPGPAVDDAEASLRSLLDQSLASLPEEDRQIVVWKYFEGDSVREIAGRLATTEKTIESRLVRLRRSLKETILHSLKHESI